MEAVAEVVIMEPSQNQKHLNKILNRLESAQNIKDGYIVKKRCTLAINVKIGEILSEYKFYKGAYKL